MRFLYFAACVSLVACQEKIAPEDIPISEDENESYPTLTMVDETITEEMSEANIPGVSACIIKAGEVAWCNGYGYANIQEGIEVNPKTPFMLASVSKTITGVALMQLADTDMMSLDEPVNNYLSFEVNHPTDPENITARMLMSHTSGIVDNWNVMGNLVVDGDSPVSLGSFMEGYLTPSGQWYNENRNFLSAGVTERAEYSNIGAALAGHLVEAVTGEDFAEYTANNIFEPLGMTETGWFVSDFNEGELAVPYEWYGGDWEAIPQYGYPDYPDGSLRTGAEQLSSFLLMFSNGGTLDGVSILSQQAVSEMKQAHYPNLDNTQGLIWYSWTVSGYEVFGHNGGDYGVSTEFGVTEDGTGFVILMNGEGRGASLGRIEAAMLSAAESL